MPCIWWIKHRCCYIERDLSLLLVRYISNAYKMFDVCMRIYVVCVRERASRRIPVCMYCLCHSCVSLGLSHGSGALLCIWQLAAAERIPESTQNNRHTQRLCTRVVSPHETEAIWRSNAICHFAIAYEWEWWSDNAPGEWRKGKRDWATNQPNSYTR